MSETRRRILGAIGAHQAEYGWPPTVREIAERIGLSSAANVLRHLQELERLGYIERGKHPRQIRLVEAASAGEESNGEV